MPKMFCIGGGDLRKDNKNMKYIHNDLINFSGITAPRILFIPTASNDSVSYFKILSTHFRAEFNLKIDVLYLTDNNYKTKIHSTDIVYVGGGNTKLLLDEWVQKGIDKILLNAAKKDIIMSGISAGAICWFEKCLANSGHKKEVLEGLGLIKGLGVPHYKNGTLRNFQVDKPMIGMSDYSIYKVDNGNVHTSGNVSIFE